MEIRCNNKQYEKYLKLYNKNIEKYFSIKLANGNSTCGVKLVLDNSLTEPVIMAQTVDDKLQSFSRGSKNVESFLKNGYVRITEKCPFKTFGKCRAEKCRYYLIKNFTGDCSFYWKMVVELN